MAFAKKLFFIALFLIILTNPSTTTTDPWAGFMWYLGADLKSWLPQTGTALNPFEITMAIILVAWAMRGRRDRRFHFERGLLFWPVVIFGGMLLFSLLWGAIQSGSNFTVALWEIRALAFGILAYFLIGILFTHRRDLNTLTWVILIAATSLGIEDIIRYWFFLPGHVVGDLDYDHADAVLLAGAILLSLGMLLLGSTRRQKLFVLTSLPINIIAIMVTHRRAGFAALAIGLVFLAIILLRANKRLFFKIVPVTALILSIYVGAEWNCNSGSSLCQPARAISSQFNPDPRDAASNAYRDTERFDLILNIQSNPITGLGFGQKFVFYVPLPDLSFWEFWQYTPHNEILWVWMKMGVFGFMAFWWLVASALYRSGRLIQVLGAAGDDKARALLAAAACLIVMQMTVSYVDLGLTDSRSMLMLWVMLGVIGHLPAILQRSTDTDVPGPSTRRIKDGRTTNVPEDVPPEVQAGILARALIAPTKTASPSRPSLSRPRQNTRKRGEPRWNQSNGATEQDPSLSLAGALQNHSSQPFKRGPSATGTSPDSFTDELPWIRNPRNHQQQGRISDGNHET